jgi:hypothetical protein
MGTGITDVIGGPHDFLPLRSDEFQKLWINKKICIRFTYFMFCLVKVKKIFSYQYCKCDAANVDIVHIEVPLV